MTVAADNLLSAALTGDPEFAAEWKALAHARHVAVEVIRYRSEKGLSQAPLAERTGVAEADVAALESGEVPPDADVLARLIGATGLDVGGVA